MTIDHRSRRRFLVPEVVQTSAMDCGPAALKCLLEGFGIPVSYGRLREACQTEVDGTSIDVLEAVAGQLGLAAEQVLLPVDHLLLPEAAALPALLVVRLPEGLTHFVLLWRRHGPLLQVMDPAIGRRWMTGRRLLEEIYVHTHPVPAEAWHEWAASDDFCRPLARRLADLGFGRSGPELIAAAVAAPGWRPLATLDAATRFVAVLIHAGAFERGRQARRALHALLERAGAETPGADLAIPEASWSVRPTPPRPDGEDQLLLRGAVLIRVHGRSSAQSPTVEEMATLGPELAAALTEAPIHPGRELIRLLRGGILPLVVLTLGIALAAGGGVLDAVLLRGALDLGRDLRLVEQRLLALGAFLIVVGVLSLIELRVAEGLARIGRRLEVLLRVALLAKLPRLHDRYFQSRPTSDMAERGHSLHQVRLLPRLAGRFLRAALTLGATAAAIAWVDPRAAPIAILAGILAIVLPLAFNPLLKGLDLRVRTHTGALSRFYLDALLGLAAVRAHGAERAVRREHEGLLVEWARANQRLLSWVVVIEGLQIVIGIALAGWIVRLHAGHAADIGGALLLAYWALSLPVLGEEIALLVRQYPIHRNVTLRLLEPLGAPEERPAGGAPDAEPRTAPGSEPAGVALTFESVAVHAAGHTILEDVDLHIDAGSQVAIIGPSGAGKSSLVGLLLGWHRAAAGRILIDGHPLDAMRLDRLRDETAWVDPAIQLWNRPLAHNLLYGRPGADPPALGEVLTDADLYDLLRRLPDGLQTPLGEGGGLLSGGEGQRVRLGRALLRSPARLVILDEPFRGLDRPRRRELLRRVRRLWQGATFLCITHDVGETLDFERVLVVEAGRITEDGPPAILAADPGSRYRALLAAEHGVREGLWSGTIWRRLRLVDGRLEGGERSEAIRDVSTNGDQLAGRPPW